MLHIQPHYLEIMIPDLVYQNVLIMIHMHRFKQLIEFVQPDAFKLQHYFMQIILQKFVEFQLHVQQNIMEKMILNYVQKNAQIQHMVLKILVLEFVFLNVLVQLLVMIQLENQYVLQFVQLYLKCLQIQFYEFAFKHVPLTIMEIQLIEPVLPYVLQAILLINLQEGAL